MHLADNSEIKTLIYPNAGKSDWKVAFRQYIDTVDRFIFVDIDYNRKDIESFKQYLCEYATLDDDEKISEPFDSETDDSKTERNSDSKHSYREIKRAYCFLYLKHKGRDKKIIFRKGFGQCALNELDDDSLYCFYHRGDSDGESGSNVFYLGNRNSHYKPIGRLFDKIISKIVDKGLIVTDGSNCDFEKLNKIYRSIKEKERKEAVEKCINKEVCIKNIILKCTAVLDYRYNHTLEWEVDKNELLYTR